MDIGRQISVLEERGHIKNEQLKNQWSGCCSKTDKHYLKFITQIAMGSAVMIFSMAQIIRGVDNIEIYFSLLSGTLGIFMPRPAIGRDADDGHH